MGASIEYLKNPRNEATENDLVVDNKCFLDLGLKPITIDSGLLSEVRDIAEKYSDNCDKSKILCLTNWNNDIDSD